MATIAFSFQTAEAKWDNNMDKGFLIPLYANNRIKQYANLYLARFFDFFGAYRFQMKRSDSLAAVYYEREFSLYPQSKSKGVAGYIRSIYNLDSTKGKIFADREIKELLRRGLQTREDYNNLQYIYATIKDNEKSRYYKELKRKNIPFDRYNVRDLSDSLSREQSAAVKENFLTEFLKEQDQFSDTLLYGRLTGRIKYSLMRSYLLSGEWRKFDRIIKDMSGHPKHFSYLDAFKRSLKDSMSRKWAIRFGKLAVEHAKKEWLKPVGEVPNNYTADEFALSNKNDYGRYADLYAQFLFEQKEYPEAWSYIQEAALKIGEGKNVQYNSHYASIAAATSAACDYVPVLEKFVITNKFDDNILSILRNAYFMVGKDADNSLEKLQIEASEALTADIRSKKINIKPPPFMLSDQKGSKVSLKDYEGKVIVLDFWATWCVPCVHSFPAMNDLVNDYLTDTNVVFLFVNTLERDQNKQTLVQNFISTNQYQFNVLLDQDNIVSNKYNVKSIPLKIVIGSDGYIKFKSSGYYGDDILKREMPIMIELAKGG